MKSILVAAVSMVGIIVVRMILSIAFTDQIAEVFARVSISILFFYYVCRLSRGKLKKKEA